MEMKKPPPSCYVHRFKGPTKVSLSFICQSSMHVYLSINSWSFLPHDGWRVVQLPCVVVKGLWRAAQPSEDCLFQAKAYTAGLLGLIARKWARETLCKHVCLCVCVCLWATATASQRWSVPAAPLMPNPLDTVQPSNAPQCASRFLYTCMNVNFWLVSLRYDIPSGVSIRACMCVHLCVLPEVTLPVELWHRAIYQVCCWLYHLAWTELCQDTKTPPLLTTPQSTCTNNVKINEKWSHFYLQFEYLRYQWGDNTNSESSIYSMMKKRAVTCTTDKRGVPLISIFLYMAL